MKIIRSVRDARGNIIQKQPQGGMGRQRCMKCQNLCTPVRTSGGKEVLQCSGCGASYEVKPLDAPKAARAGVVPKR